MQEQKVNSDVILFYIASTRSFLFTSNLYTIHELLAADPEELSASISGASVKTVNEWQTNAKALMNS